MIATGNWGACEWTITEEGELRIGGGAAESVSADGTYPWDEYRESIRRISFEGAVTGVVSLIGAFMNCSHLEEIDFKGLDTSNAVDLSWLLCGCGRLEKVDLSMLDTSKVVDMSCMFLYCGDLQEIDLGSIDISSVMDMSKMFMGCSSLKSLDVSTLDNGALQMTDDMFFGCDSLRALVPGKNFSLGGSGHAVIALPERKEGPAGETGEEDKAEDPSVKASDWRTSTDGVIYIAGTDFTMRYDGNGAQPAADADIEEKTCVAGTQLRAQRDLFEPPQGWVFREWNTRRDGSGRKLLPGQLFNVHSDMTLYAIWAASPVFLDIEDIPETVYGNRIEVPQPRIDSRRGEELRWRMEIRNAADSDWETFDDTQILPVQRNGARIRFVAENSVGETISDEKTIHIRRAEYDMSDVHWVIPEDLTYTGEEFEVHLEGLPEGVAAEYVGNVASAVGQYRASVQFRYDEDNYLPPAPMEDLRWSITKGKYKMEDLSWSYLQAYTYDGQTKSVRLEGLPEGTIPYYDGADAVNAGTYVATAGLDYDIDNYDSPDPVMPCTWKILKTTHDMSGVHWEAPDVFVYDGTPKKVELSGLPQGVRAEYTGNVAVDAGCYTARAAFVLDDPVNYEIPQPVAFDWEISKAHHNVDDMAWTRSDLVYDGGEQSVRLTGVPEGVSVLYEGDTAVEAGEYMVRAEFFVEDLNNYHQMDPITNKWEIQRADIDMSAVRWNYSSPYIYNGAEKSVTLKNIPPQIESVSYSGSRATSAGSYVARAEFTYDADNYNAPLIQDCRWAILKANLKLQDLQWDYDAPFTYDGEEHAVRITNLPDNAEVTYENDRAAAAGVHVTTAHITPLDPQNFNTPQPVQHRWEIRKAVFDISGFYWEEDGPLVYDGTARRFGMKGLPEGIRVSYEGNEAVEAGTYQAKAVFAVEDTDNYIAPSPEEINWSIEPAFLDLTGVSWDYETPFTYDGSEKEILLKGLPEGVTARYSGNVASDAGEYSAQAVLVPAEGTSYKETPILGKIWRVQRADIDVSAAHWVVPEDFVYDGMLKQVALAGLPSGIRVEYAQAEAVEAGSYRAEAKLTPYDERNFNAPTISGCSWKIARADIDMSEVDWSGYETFVYDGSVHRVILKNLPDLVEAVYQGNSATDAGSYIAVAQFRPIDERNFNTPRQMQYEWSVAKAPINAENVYWTSGGDELVYDGQEHGVQLAGLPQNVKAVCQGNTAVDVGQYIASAVLEPEDYVNYLPCVIEPYRWEIEKAEIDLAGVMWASSGELVYDGTIKVVGLTGLPDDISVEYENNVAMDAGTYHASAVLTAHSNNYTAPEIEGCTWTIEKAVPDISGVTWSYAFEFTYDGYEKSVELLDLPEGMKAEYSGNAAIEAGDYVAEARLIMDDPMNYEAPVVSPLQWKIAKRDYDMSQVRWTGEEGFVYDGMVKTVELTGLEDGLEPIYQDNAAVDAGVYTASARFLYDEDNYNPPEELSFTWEIRKAPLDISGVRWNYDGPFRAGGRMRTVTLQSDGPQQGLMGKMLSKNKEQNYLGLPEGTQVRYEGNSAKAAGVYEAKAYLTIPPQPNHEVTGPICLTWEIIDG